MRISDWSSDVCSSDLKRGGSDGDARRGVDAGHGNACRGVDAGHGNARCRCARCRSDGRNGPWQHENARLLGRPASRQESWGSDDFPRSEEHTSAIQSLIRISSAVFCLKQTTPTTLNTMITYTY